jgi:hypothetical protein
MNDPTPADLTRARKTWRTVEPFHGMIYFVPEAAERYAALGLTGSTGYFASRAAAMGDVSAGVVVATFYNFNPALVASAIPAAWGLASPASVIEARLAAADAALRRIVPDAVDSPAVARAAELARRAAEVCGEHAEGRPLFAAHAALEWPKADHLVLWQAQSLLREFRGDGHIAALVLEGLSGLQALVVHAASGDIPADMLRLTRGWSEAEWLDATETLREKGWLRPGPELTLSEQGAQRRQEMEDRTDRLAVLPYQVLGDDSCEELRTLVRPWSRALSAVLFG